MKKSSCAVSCMTVNCFRFLELFDLELNETGEFIFACRNWMMSKLLNIFDDAQIYFMADVEYEELEAKNCICL